MSDFWNWTIDEELLKDNLIESYDEGEHVAKKAKKVKELLETELREAIDDQIREAMNYFKHEALEEIGWD